MKTKEMPPAKLPEASKLLGRHIPPRLTRRLSPFLLLLQKLSLGPRSCSFRLFPFSVGKILPCEKSSPLSALAAYKSSLGSVPPRVNDIPWCVHQDIYFLAFFAPRETNRSWYEYRYLHEILPQEVGNAVASLRDEDPNECDKVAPPRSWAEAPRTEL